MLEDIRKRIDNATVGPWRFDIAGSEDYSHDSDCGRFVSGEIKVMDFGDSTQYYPSEGEAPTGYDKILIEHIHEDYRHMLSLIDKYETTLKETKDELAKLVNKMCGGTVPKHVFLEAREVYYSVSRSLEKE